MKIIQILTEQDGPLYGLGEDGNVYEYWERKEPLKAVKKSINAPGVARCAANPLGLGTEPVYKDGSTGGWKLLVRSSDVARPVPHPEDPTRCERS